jgi:hypothetical protein
MAWSHSTRDSSQRAWSLDQSPGGVLEVKITGIGTLRTKIVDETK